MTSDKAQNGVAALDLAGPTAVQGSTCRGRAGALAVVHRVEVLGPERHAHLHYTV